MKKFFSFMAVAVAGVLVASAAVQPQTATSAIDVTPQTVNKTVKMSTGDMKIARVGGVQKVAANRDECIGLYKVSYMHYLLNGNPKPPFNVSITKGAGENDLIIENFLISGMNLKATFNNGNIVIPEQAVSTTLSDGQGGYVTYEADFMGCDVTVDAEGNITNLNEGSEVIFYPAEGGGFVTVDELHGLSLRLSGTTDRYYLLCTGVMMTAPDFFVYDASEWEDHGNAEFTDDFINKMFQGGPAVTTPQSVPCKKKKTDDGWYLLENPYRCGEWAQYNQYAVQNNLNGYIVFNISNPEIVYTRPMTGCGLWVDESEDNDGSAMTEYYPYNREGQYIVTDGWDPLDAYDDLIGGRMTPSSYDEATRTVLIQNVLFGDSSAPDGTWWFGADNPITFTIVLPDPAGISDIEFNENAPVRYYNLQGVEVVNPVKGQLVIKTQGNKAQKVIVK